MSHRSLLACVGDETPPVWSLATFKKEMIRYLGTSFKAYVMP